MSEPPTEQAQGEMLLTNELMRAINRATRESDLSMNQIVGVLENLKFELQSSHLILEKQNNGD